MKAFRSPCFLSCALPVGTLEGVDHEVEQRPDRQASTVVGVDCYLRYGVSEKDSDAASDFPELELVEIDPANR